MWDSCPSSGTLEIHGSAAWAACSIPSHIPSSSTFSEHGFCMHTPSCLGCLVALSSGPKYSHYQPASSVQSKSLFFEEKLGQKSVAWVPSAFSYSHIQWEFEAPESCPNLCLQVLKFESLFILDSFRYLFVQLCCTKLTLYIVPLSVVCAVHGDAVFFQDVSLHDLNPFQRVSSGNMWNHIDYLIQIFPLFSSLLSLYLQHVI